MEYLVFRGGRGGKIGFDTLYVYSLAAARRVAKAWLTDGASSVRIEGRAEVGEGGRASGRAAYKARRASRTLKQLIRQRARGVRVCRLEGKRMVCAAQKKRKRK